MNILRSIVAAPTSTFFDDELGITLNLAYISKSIIVTSGPVDSCSFKSIYRYPVSDLVKFLNYRHGSSWCLWNFKAEDSEYNDKEFGNKVVHFPFPDHQPPPFHLISKIVVSIDKFLSQNPQNVAVLHCKAGKGRSGTMACAFLMYKENYSAEEATRIFTQHRMNSGFGSGVSIKSQVRYLQYWSTFLSDKVYVSLADRIYLKSVTISNPYFDLNIGFESFVNDGAELKEICKERLGKTRESSQSQAIYWMPSQDVALTEDLKIVFDDPYSFINGSFYTYTWINIFFETILSNPEMDPSDMNGSKLLEGQFHMAWEKLDGLKGTIFKGVKLFDSFEIMWYIK